MAREVERKFLVADDGWRGVAGSGRRLRQVYLTEGGAASVRVRTMDNATAFLTVKSAVPALCRAEYEYSVPVADAEEMFALRAGSIVEKTRFPVPHAGHRWDVDVYAGENEGLVVAEVELRGEEEPVDLPPWIGREITGDARYYAAALARSPFRAWGDSAPREAR